MRSTAVFAFALLAVATQVAAQTRCSAQNILDTCIKTYQPRLDKCTGNNWECYCQESRNILTCYNNCPDTDASGPKNQAESYCNAWSASLPSSTSGAVAPSGSAVATGTSLSGAAGSSTAGSSASASAAADNAADAVVVAKGMGVAAGLVAVAGAFL